jgi:hypothetical protein
MSLPPDYQPFLDEEEDRKRKAEIEEMMRSQREFYFRNEPVQQEYRDIVDRQIAAQRADDEAARGPGPLDEALEQYRETKLAAAPNPPQADVSGSSYLFDGGEAEAKSIFRRNDEASLNESEALPDAGVGKGDRLPVSAPELPQPPSGFPNSSVGKGDRLPISRPQLPQSPSAFDPMREPGPGHPLRRQDDPARAFEVEPFERVDRVIELQGQLDKNGQFIKDRPYALHELLKEKLNIAAQKTGLVVEVHSGGQVAKGEVGRRLEKSGPRHNHGNAGDVDLFEVVNGKKRKLDARKLEDQKKMADFIQYSVAAGATGIGFGYSYMGPSRIHIGGGDEAVWRDIKEDKTLNTPLPWVVEAVEKGKAMRAVAGAVARPGRLIDGYSHRNLLERDDEWGNYPYETNSSSSAMMKSMIDTDMLARNIDKRKSIVWPNRGVVKTK